MPAKRSALNHGVDLAVEKRVDRVLRRGFGARPRGRELTVDHRAGARHQRAEPMCSRLGEDLDGLVRDVALEAVARGGEDLVHLVGNLVELTAEGRVGELVRSDREVAMLEM